MKVASGALILIISLTIIEIPLTDAATDKIFCSFGSWANYRSGNGNFKVEDIDARLCTHILYQFIGITQDGSIRILDPWLDFDLGGYSRTIALKQINPDLKVMVVMGGWNEESSGFSKSVATPEGRSKLAFEVVAFLSSHKFDGISLDWNYPGDRGGVAADKANFVELLRLLRHEFDQSDRNFILAAAVGVSNERIAMSYDIPGINYSVDYILLQSFDLRGAWDTVIGHTAPLYESNLEQSRFANLNVDAVVKNWIQKGASKEKLILGITLSGRSFTLSNESNNAVGAPNSGPGNTGPYTRYLGVLLYLEICESFKAGGWTTVWDDQQKVPYSYKGNQWIGYEGSRSIKLKTQYAIDNGLHGVMVDGIEADDFRGLCGIKYHLINAIKEALGRNLPLIPTTTTTTQRPTYECTSPGLHADPLDCSKFYYCSMENGEPVKYDCPAGLHFNKNAGVCEYPYNAQC